MLRNILKKTCGIVRDEQGITAIEYAILGSLVALGIVTASTGLATSIAGVFTRIGTAIGVGT